MPQRVYHELRARSDAERDREQGVLKIGKMEQRIANSVAQPRLLFMDLVSLKKLCPLPGNLRRPNLAARQNGC